MKITIKPKDSGLHNYCSNLNCPIARGLRRKGIFACVSPDDWWGLFLGFIPVWGKIEPIENDLAHQVAAGKISSNVSINVTLYK